MDSLFIINIFLSFFIAGSWIAFATLFAEKLGNKLGGMIANLPSNILVSFIFISIVKDVDYVAEASMAVPIGLIGTTIFMLAFIFLLKYGLKLASVISIFIWFVIAIILNKIGAINIILAISLYLLVVVISVYIIEISFKVKSVAIQKKHYSIYQVIGRAVFAGSIVALVVVLSKFVPPFFTGIMAAFPAMIFSTLFILTKHQGPKFAMATGKILVLTTTNILIYVVAVHLFYPKFGVLYGTLLSYFVAVVWVSLLFPIIKKMA